MKQKIDLAERDEILKVSTQIVKERREPKALERDQSHASPSEDTDVLGKDLSEGNGGVGGGRATWS